MSEVPGIYYDGLTARAHAVTLSIDIDMLVVQGHGIERRDPIGALQVMDAIGESPRIIRFVGGASCEVTDRDGLAALLAGHGLAHDSVAAWDRSWRVVLGGLVFVAVLAFVTYRFGLPALARTTADRLPASALDTLSSQMQGVLERTVFAETKIPHARQIALTDAFRKLRLPSGTARRLQITFKRSESLGANAIALPSGAIFVTDGLVEMTEDDRLIVAVLAHEAGHVHRRHGLRQIIQSTIMGGLVTWYIGDVSALGAAAPTALLQAKYSRDLEREADAYAADVLRLNGLPVSVLADALEALERTHGGRGEAGALAYLSSHPATTERMSALRDK